MNSRDSFESTSNNSPTHKAQTSCFNQCDKRCRTCFELKKGAQPGERIKRVDINFENCSLAGERLIFPQQKIDRATSSFHESDRLAGEIRRAGHS